MKSALVLAALGLASAKNESNRYIISYDENSWNTNSLSHLPKKNVTILKEMRMQIADLDEEEIKEFESLPGVTLHKDAAVQLPDETSKADTKNSWFTDIIEKYNVVETAQGKIQLNPSWGLDRIDQRDLPLDRQYHLDAVDGKGVDVWVIDSGIRIDHEEFEGRAIFERNFVGDGQNTDCAGHGTHVASTIGGKSVGVAKGVTLRAVKVLNCFNRGALSDFITGINYAVAEHKKVPGRKSVINMSIAAPLHQPINMAVMSAVNAGIPIVIAAGNFQARASDFSPSSVAEAIIVGASDNNDKHAWFSNYGSCVTLYAPGVQIKGAFIRSKDDYLAQDGTSMAAPHVSGVAALLLARGEATNHAEVKAKLLEHSTKTKVQNVPSNTASGLLYIPPLTKKTVSK